MARSATAALCTLHERFSCPVCKSYTRSIRLRDAATRVLQSGLTAKAVMGSESCKTNAQGLTSLFLVGLAGHHPEPGMLCKCAT